MFTEEMTNQEKRNYCYGFVIEHGKDFPYSENGFRVLQYLSQDDHACSDVEKGLEALYLHIVGLSK
ncbi:MAG: hypothetical protein GY821_17960 [Gammaproteobacteria bacterium]|nr:hypothetical protein [Gammaproteobacteria bacterium]